MAPPLLVVAVVVPVAAVVVAGSGPPGPCQEATVRGEVGGPMSVVVASALSLAWGRAWLAAAPAPGCACLPRLLRGRRMLVR
jgi:hypothetical protein